ncbi:DUF72 domain-containing protein [Parachryseolinea silvisoli]|jgi:uncharacterized protein YecE (DUF72 family)|uniref:DUF72 domain-containing protein n=1 Tax=Parachryseolinea silvisoli TaxID=2873601 RepID=UPI0022658CA4|nr:DUF72 domain-containing protein [Parachryseolinea silvisoli]MCD9016546.1 DUF72 domain-containing protein [Parachryseolinea silvisoli]
MRKGKIYIGTSGWSYKHWAGTFYPEDIKADKQFAYYQDYFDTVELNNSFYHLPDRTTFRKWKEATPENFIFSVKGSRYISHMKKLSDAREPLRAFLHNARGLGRKLGPVLFQLPPGWKLNLERLQTFLKQLPPTLRVAFEFRNMSWYTPEVYEALRAHDCAFCMYELAGHLSPLEVTADFVYIRLHGPGAKYQGSYRRTMLKKWAKRLLAWRDKGIDSYIYFDNDQAGYAAFNAQTLQELING